MAEDLGVMFQIFALPHFQTPASIATMMTKDSRGYRYVRDRTNVLVNGDTRNVDDARDALLEQC
jgi:hypothetical protein